MRDGSTSPPRPNASVEASGPPGDSHLYRALQCVRRCWNGSASRVPLQLRVDWRVDSQYMNVSIVWSRDVMR